MNAEIWLPMAFAGLMALSLLMYVVLDGYDLGVGILLPFAKDDDKDTMVSSIGPFWDANETWLVLGVGLLLVAFPKAHGIILQALYLPVTVMLIGLILRGVAFDFRVKAGVRYKGLWNRVFAAGSLIASMAQGVMLGRYLTAFEPGWQAWAFALLVGVGLSAAYVLLGACWLIMKSEGTLQRQAIGWARYGVFGTALCVAAVSLVTPLVSERIAAKWFEMPEFFLLLPLPLLTLALFVLLLLMLPRLDQRLGQGDQHLCWLPFSMAVGIFLLSFYGLSYSVFPDVIIDKLDIWEAAAHPQALWVIFIGAVVVLPAIVAYTVFVYRVFWGKTRELTYF